MNWGILLEWAFELSYLLGVFALFVTWATLAGRQAMINVIFGLYLALLFYNYVPFTSHLTSNLGNELAQSVGSLVVFAIITIMMTWVTARVMPEEFRETKLESMHKKIMLAGAASILVMIFSFHVLPVTAFLTPGTPVQTLFGPEQFFFYWLLAPITILIAV